MQFVIHSWPVPQELLLLLHLDAPSVTEHEGMLGRSMPYKTQLLAMASNLITMDIVAYWEGANASHFVMRLIATYFC